MGDVLMEAAARLETAANDINAIDLSQETEAVGAFVNNIANLLNSLSQAVSAAKDAFHSSLDQAEVTPSPEAPPPGAPQTQQPPAEG